MLPKIFGYNLVSHKEYLEDGTVVNVVRLTSYLSLGYTLKLFRLVQKGEACLEYADFLSRIYWVQILTSRCSGFLPFQVKHATRYLDWRTLDQSA